MKDHSDEDYEKFRSDCVRREFNCDSVGNVDQLSEDEVGARVYIFNGGGTT